VVAEGEFSEILAEGLLIRSHRSHNADSAWPDLSIASGSCVNGGCMRSLRTEILAISG
jgi:hypothetical protein